MPKPQHDLGSAELEVLRALWDVGPATVRDVLTHLHAKGRTVAYTTVMTFLSRLETKGFATSDKSGMAYVYTATVSHERVVRSRLRSLLDQLFDGAAGQLALQLIKTEQFSPDEIHELHQLINRMDSGAKAGDSAPSATKKAN